MLKEASYDIAHGCDLSEIFNDLEANIIALQNSGAPAEQAGNKGSPKLPTLLEAFIAGRNSIHLSRPNEVEYKYWLEGWQLRAGA